MPPPNKPRSIVGKLLARIKGQDTSPTPPSPPQTKPGPKDPDKAMLLYTRLRDAALRASQQQLILGGQLEARRKAIVTELEADRYDQASDLLDAIDGDLEAEYQHALKRLKDEFGALRAKVLEAAKTPSTSPTVANLLKTINDLVGLIETNVKSRAVTAAAAQIDPLAAQLNAFEKQLLKDQQAYDKLALQLKSDLSALVWPVVKMETQQAKASAESARLKAEAGDAYGAVVLATKARKECETAVQLRNAYEQSLTQAQNTVQTQLGQMFPLDSQRITTDFIEAAKKKAQAGERQAALDLLGRVSAECVAAKRTRATSGFNSANNTLVADEMDKLLKHAQRPALKTEIDALHQRYSRVKANESLTKATMALLSEIYWECKRLSGLADQHGTYTTRHDTVVKPKVDKLRTDGPGDTVKALEAEIAAVETQFAKAGRQAAKRLYELAGDTLGEVEKGCVRVAQLKTDHARYATLRKDVDGILQSLSGLKPGSPLEAAVKRLQARLAQATEQGQVQRQFAAAAQALLVLKTEAEALVQSSNGHGEALKAAKTAAGDPAAVQELLDKLKAHAGQAGAKTQIDEMGTLLRQAAKTSGKDAADLLGRAADGYVAGLQHAELHAGFEARVKAVVAPGKAELDGSLPAIATLIQRIDEQTGVARDLSVAQNHAQAGQRLDGALALIAQARKLTVDIQGCTSRFTALKTVDVPGLTSHNPPEADPTIGKDIQVLNRDLVQADRLIKSRDYEAALEALDRVEAQCHKASIKKKVSDGGLTAEQMAEQCKQLAGRANGQAALDELVEAFKGGQSVDGVLAAMKARFKLDDAQCLRTAGDDDAKVTQELCALYATMTKVPAKHTRDNPSFKKIVRKAESGSAYNSGEKAIKMGEGHPDMSSEYPIGRDSEVPGVDDNCKPNPDAKPVKFFDWNTWHEVGHAMDDRKQFMNKRAGQATFGGWQTHGGDIMAVAQAVADELKGTYASITAQMVAKYLNDGTSPLPQPAGWAKVTAWAAATKHDRDPWAAGAKCANGIASGGLKVGDRIYHQGYEGRWFSYLAAARKQGITGYQFRAPGEWFSELYAAYKSGKLNNSHPARTWLDELFHA